MKNFDLPETLRSISSLYLRMQVLSNFAWRIDTLIVAQCRTLFKAFKMTPTAISLDDDAELRSAIAQGLWTEQLFDEVGPGTVQPVKNLQQLACMRLAAHEIAQNATSLVPWGNGDPRTYKLPEITDLFEPNGGIDPKGTSLIRMQMTADRSAKRLASGAEATVLAKRLLDRKIAGARADALGRKHAMSAQVDSLLAIYEYSMREVPESLDTSFNALHIDVQRTLIESAEASAERAVKTAEENPKEVSDDEFGHLIVAQEKLADQLKAVLASPRFNGGIVAVRVQPQNLTVATKPVVLKPNAVVKAPVSDIDKRKAAAKTTTMKAKVEKAAAKTPPVTAVGQALAAAAVTDTAPNDL